MENRFRPGAGVSQEWRFFWHTLLVKTNTTDQGQQGASELTLPVHPYTPTHSLYLLLLTPQRP